MCVCDFYAIVSWSETSAPCIINLSYKFYWYAFCKVDKMFLYVYKTCSKYTTQSTAHIKWNWDRTDPFMLNLRKTFHDENRFDPWILRAYIYIFLFPQHERDKKMMLFDICQNEEVDEKKKHNSTTEILRFSAKINKLYWSKNVCSHKDYREESEKKVYQEVFSHRMYSVYAVVYCFLSPYNNSINDSDGKSCIYL